MGIAANSLRKVKILGKNGPAEAPFAVKRSDNRIWSNIDGNQRVLNPVRTITITADTTLAATDSGATIIINANDTKTVTLPAPAEGLEFLIFVKVASTSGVGHTIHPSGGSAKLYAKGFTAAAGKGAVNTQATSAIGDAFYVYSDGTDWYGLAEAGTWAREA